MGLFGLGDFGTGFVEGFAKSANEALKEDLRKVDLRVEKVAEAKMKRALKQQEERAEELEEIEDALNEGKTLFGDDPRAAQYAASLLKDQGNITAYKQFIANLRKKRDESGIDPAGFFARAEVDAPASKGFTVSDYAKAYQGAPKTLPDYKGIDDKTMTAGAGRLLSAIGFDPDVRGQIDSSVAEQMAASGIVEEAKAERVTLPSIDFDSEEWNLADKDASAKIKYYNEKLVNPRLNETARAKYEEKLQAQLGIAADSKDDEIRISALEQQLSRADEADKGAIQKQIIEINVRKKRREAQAAVDDGSDVMAVNKLDKADAWRRSQDESLSAEEREKARDKFYSIGEVISDFSKGEPTVANKYAKRREEHRRRQVEDPTYVAGTPEFDAEVEELERLKGISEDGSTEDATTTGITSSVKAIDLIISTNPTVTANIPNNKRFQQIKKLVDGADTISAGLALIDKEPGARQIYDEGMAAMRSAGQPIVDQYIASLTDAADKASAIAAAKLLGYDVSSYSSPVTKTPATAATDETTTLAVEDVVTPLPPIEDSEKGARDAIAAQKKGPGGYTIEEIKADIAEAKTQYSPAFVKVLEDELKVMQAAIGTDETMVRTAMEPGIDYEKAAEEDKGIAVNDVATAVKIIDETSGFASKEIRAIAKRLNISKEEATKLHADATAAIAKRREENKPTRKRSNRSRSGLMARN